MVRYEIMLHPVMTNFCLTDHIDNNWKAFTRKETLTNVYLPKKVFCFTYIYINAVRSSTDHFIRAVENVYVRSLNL